MVFMHDYKLMAEAVSIPVMPDVDWKYSMRREMQEIIPGLYLGPYAVATKTQGDNLRAVGITHMVCVRHPSERNVIRTHYPERFMYLVIEIPEDGKQNIIQFFHQANEFITNSLHQGGKVLVYGNGMCCESTAVVIAFIMQHFRLSFDSAEAYTRERRFCIILRGGLIDQLREYEPIYKAQLMHRAEGQVDERASMKRKFEREEAEMDCDSVT